MPRYGRIDKDYGMHLATCDPGADGGIYMLNLMKYRETADYDGEAAAISGREADDKYAPVDVLTAIGASVCFHADVVASSEDWDRVGVVRYPTRRSFVEMQSRPDFQDKHVHKEAGMDHTIVMGTLPHDALPARVKPNRVLLEVWNGAPPEPIVDGPSAVFDVEGTIIGNGRAWTGARYTVVDRDADVTIPDGVAHQVLLLQPSIERWV